MNNLEQTRELINKIDEEMAKLFCKRMEAAEKIALYKKENGLPVFDARREADVIKRNSEKIENSELKLYYKQFLQSQMDISKSFQRSVINDNNTITVNLVSNSYDIIVKRQVLQDADKYFNLARKVLVVTDSGVPKEYAESIAKLSKTPVTVTLPQGEATKSIENLQKLYSVMQENSFSRNDCVVAVGGGVIGDLSGYAAATYMRGIDFYNCPTTLLSQVDSSIGGKVAVNFGSTKNIIGTFYQPKCVLIDPDVLKTLDNKQFASGLAESIKMGLTSDKELFVLIETGDIENNIETIIIKSLLVKKNVVELDEKEQGIRKILNFGHTLGHAIEAENIGKLYHGECVALGMIPMCSDNVRPRLLSILKRVHLPTEIKYDTAKISEHLRHDKKVNENGVSAVFVDKIGSYQLKNVSIDYLIGLLQEKL